MSENEDLPQYDSEPEQPQTTDAVQLESGPPLGMRRSDADGRPIIDALAGRSSIFGFGFQPIVEAIQAAAEGYLGDASSLEQQKTDPGPLRETLQELLGDSSGVQVDSMLLLPSADEAIDRAIGLARCNGSENAFRTIAFVGSDHGRTGMCRTASGQPDLSAGFGPMMAGFAHVPIGDLGAVRSVIDDQTAAVLLSPIDFADAARPVEASFLTGLRELCDQHNVMLVIDETRIAFGASGQPLTFASIAGIQAEMVILSAGLFGGLPGGLIVGSEQATDGAVFDTGHLPVQSAVAAATLTEMNEQNLLESASDLMHEFAVELAETLGGFQFIRDLHVTGMTLGVQADIECRELIQVARSEGLRIESAGETAIRLQVPLVIRDQDRQHLLEMMKRAMESVERKTASLGV
jgi:acetylornithine/succinyldiaminopimelate/putrescine aminotransferase